MYSEYVKRTGRNGCVQIEQLGVKKRFIYEVRYMPSWPTFRDVLNILLHARFNLQQSCLKKKYYFILDCITYAHKRVSLNDEKEGLIIQFYEEKFCVHGNTLPD